MKFTILIACILLTSCYGKEPVKTGKEGKLLPDFSLLLMDSTSIFNTKDIPSGKPFVLFVFGPHCPYSKAQMQAMVDNMGELTNIHFYIFTLAPFNQVKQFADKYQLDKYANVTIGIDTSNIFGQYMSITGVPYLAVYDENKQLKKSFEGNVNIRLIKAIAEN